MPSLYTELAQKTLIRAFISLTCKGVQKKTVLQLTLKDAGIGVGT